MATQDPSFVAPVRPRLWRRWPVTTLAGIAGLLSLGVVMATGAGAPATAEEFTDEEAMAFEEEAPASLEIVDIDERGSRHKGEEGKMGKPTARSKSGLYAMKGPKDAIPSMARSPHDGAFAVGSDDSDVWGGLTGTEVGESYGVGGLGLVGTGRGGGGTGEGTIGLGSPGLAGKGGAGAGRRADAPVSRFDSAIQSNVLTVGTTDDNADPTGYRKALARMASERAALGIPDHMYDLAAPQQRHAAAPGRLEVALVIDTTGSMGDELEYLKVELRDIARQISRDFPGVQQRWGLVVYRDAGDAYVARKADFRAIDPFVTALGEQSADGGGDTPEAMDIGLATSAGLSWHTGADTARMVFLVADAPSHNGDPARNFASAAIKHREMGTAIYPVAASGVTPDAEAELRLAAKVTGGQYIFLTDHSGVGGHHAAPHVDQYKVETLHAAMTRMIRGELGGPGEATRLAAVTGEPGLAMLDLPALVEVDGALLPVAVPGLSLWDQVQERLTAHLMFASSMALLMFAAMGVDAFIGRRRRMRRMYEGRE